MLIIFGGLPGVGKTTLSRALARHLKAVHVRIDTIEHAIASSLGAIDLADAGYRVGYVVAEDNLRAGLPVVADSVNPLEITRAAWRAVGQRAGVPVREVEVVCSDPAEHRQRVETRVSDIAGFTLPTWAKVESRLYEAWPSPHVTIDTAGRSPEECLWQVLESL